MRPESTVFQTRTVPSLHPAAITFGSRLNAMHWGRSGSWIEPLSGRSPGRSQTRTELSESGITARRRSRLRAGGAVEIGGALGNSSTTLDVAESQRWNDPP